MPRHDDPTEEIPTTTPHDAALAEPPLIAPGRRLAERYLLEERIGHGGMAVVWLARDERLDREVAIKVLSDTLTADRDYIDRFSREARVAAGLQHPNLVQVYDYGAGARPYLVMEYVEGGDLSELLEVDAEPPADQLAEELLSALSYIHAAGVLHRDIKPQNVLVDSYGHARLTDFGIARPANEAALTRTGEVIGTESFLAPEVAAGEPASERSDLYSLGVLLEGPAGLGADPALRRLVDRLCDPDPDDRPSSADAALAELERGYAGAPFSPTPNAVRPRRRRLRPVVAIGVAALAGVALALVLGGGDDGEPRRSASARPERARTSTVTETATQTQTATATETEPAATPGAAEPPPKPEPAQDGFALNDQGFSLIGAGRFAEAVPVLERAVTQLRESGDEATYNYALFNLASAYMGAGRPADAIPLLEERMRFDDGQLGEVGDLLERARAEGD